MTKVARHVVSNPGVVRRLTGGAAYPRGIDRRAYLPTRVSHRRLPQVWRHEARRTGTSDIHVSSLGTSPYVCLNYRQPLGHRVQAAIVCAKTDLAAAWDNLHNHPRPASNSVDLDVRAELLLIMPRCVSA